MHLNGLSWKVMSHWNQILQGKQTYLDIHAGFKMASKQPSGYEFWKMIKRKRPWDCRSSGRNCYLEIWKLSPKETEPIFSTQTSITNKHCENTTSKIQGISPKYPIIGNNNLINSQPAASISVSDENPNIPLNFIYHPPWSNINNQVSWYLVERGPNDYYKSSKYKFCFPCILLGKLSDPPPPNILTKACIYA